MDPRHLSALTIQENSAQEFLGQRAFPLSIQRHLVFLFDFKARMGELLREIAVVRKQEQSFTLGIETSNIEKARKLWRKQIENRVAGVRITAGRNKASRFVQRNRHRALEMNELAVDFHMIALAWLRAEIGANPAIDRDLSGRNQRITFSPRTDASCGQEPI